MSFSRLPFAALPMSFEDDSAQFPWLDFFLSDDVARDGSSVVRDHSDEATELATGDLRPWAAAAWIASLEGGVARAQSNSILQPETADAAGVLTIDGPSGDDALVVTTTGADVGTYSLNGAPVVPFTGLMSLTFNGGAGNDLVTVHNPDGGLFAPSGGIFVNGGAQSGDPGDSLAIVGGAIDTASFTTAGNHADGKDGTIVLTHGAVTATYTYTGLEPLANPGTAANIVFTLPAGPDTVVIEDDGTPGNNIS